jgi:hypothetical protein
MPLRKMKVSDWIKVQDNPIQRDTERHAAKAKHLLTPLSIHAVVYAAELPNGKLVKLDGHTRALLWSRNQVRHPPEVECIVLPAESMEEAKRLYQTLDSKEALENIRDKISGAFRDLNFYPESGLLKQGNIANALRLCWNVMIGKAITGGSGAMKSETGYSLYSAVREFSSEIFALDAFDEKHFNPTSGVIAAFILTVRKHGSKIIPFWRSVFADGGEKKDGKMDGIQALCELVLQRRGRAHGGSAVADVACRCVMAAEGWLEDKEFTRVPRPYDLTAYIDHAKPAVQLIKGKKED